MSSSEQETQPLLRKSSTGNNSVRFSQTSEILGESERALDPVHPGGLSRSSSSISNVLERFTQSQREEALQKEGVGAAAFLIHDAVLGDLNASVGMW